MFGLGRTAAMATVAAVLGAGLLGSVALGAFSPVAAQPYSMAPDLAATIAPTEGPKGDGLKHILDGLVTKGVITQAQEDAIVAAIRDARPGDGHVLERIVMGLLHESADYLGMGLGELKQKLPGTSLGAIADATAGKSRDGLVATLTSAANAAIDKALAEHRITQEQADKAKAAVPDRIAKLVDRTWPQRSPMDRAPSAKAFLGDVMSTARDYLGLSQQDLATQLRSGRSLGQIADATAGKSRDGLVAALTSAANTRIDEAQAAGKLTADQAAALRTRVPTFVAQLVDHNRVKAPGR
jgi:hypothetical protein